MDYNLSHSEHQSEEVQLEQLFLNSSTNESEQTRGKKVLLCEFVFNFSNFIGFGILFGFLLFVLNQIRVGYLRDMIPVSSSVNFIISVVCNVASIIIAGESASRIRFERRKRDSVFVGEARSEPGPELNLP